MSKIVELIPANKEKDAQNRFLLAYISCNFGLALALDSAGVATETFYRWLDDYPDFNQRLCDMHQSLVVKAESRLAQLLDSPDESIALNAAKTILHARGRHLGYNAKEDPRQGHDRPTVEIDEALTQEEASQALLAVINRDD